MEINWRNEKIDEEIAKLIINGYTAKTTENVELYLSEKINDDTIYKFEQNSKEFDFNKHLEEFPINYKIMSYARRGEEKNIIINERGSWTYVDINEVKERDKKIRETKGEEQILQDRKHVENEREIINYLKEKRGVFLEAGDLITTYGVWEDNEQVKIWADNFIDGLTREYFHPEEIEAFYTGKIKLEDWNKDWYDWHEDFWTNLTTIDNLIGHDGPYIDEDIFWKFEDPMMDITRKFMKDIAKQLREKTGEINYEFENFGNKTLYEYKTKQVIENLQTRDILNNVSQNVFDRIKERIENKEKTPTNEEIQRITEIWSQLNIAGNATEVNDHLLEDLIFEGKNFLNEFDVLLPKKDDVLIRSEYIFAEEFNLAYCSTLNLENSIRRCQELYRYDNDYNNKKGEMKTSEFLKYKLKYDDKMFPVIKQLKNFDAAKDAYIDIAYEPFVKFVLQEIKNTPDNIDLEYSKEIGESIEREIHNKIFGYYNSFYAEANPISKEIEKWWNDGTRKELLKTAQELSEKDKMFEDVLNEPYWKNCDTNISAFDKNWLEKGHAIIKTEGRTESMPIIKNTTYHNTIVKSINGMISLENRLIWGRPLNEKPEHGR